LNIYGFQGYPQVRDLDMNGYPLEMTKSFWTGFKVPSGADISQYSDNELALQASRGNIALFQALVERYRRQAYFYARGMVRNSDDAHDLSQEAFVRVYRHLKRFNPAYPFKVWLFHILSNLCKNHLRQKKTRDNVMVTSDDAGESAAPDTDQPDRLFGRTEVQSQVWNAIGKLPEKFREIIILSHFEELSYNQMAEILGIPRGSVMSRLYYARLKLREILEEMGVEL
jgi:RNA polymerase sigma-70 factor (ECF subfamily)